MEVGRDPPAFVGRRLDGVDEQGLPLVLAPTQRRASLHASGTCTGQRSSSLGEQAAGERQPDLGGPSARAMLDRWYVSNRRGVPFGARIGVHLVQAALRRARSGSRRRDIAPLGAVGARPEHRQLESPSGIRAPDQPRLVRVEDAALRAPDLDPDDAVAEHALLDEPVEALRSGAGSER